MLVKTPSTVAAVETLLRDEEEGRSSAAIASSVCERLFDGIQILQKGIQDEKCELEFVSRPPRVSVTMDNAAHFPFCVILLSKFH